jgi:putative oxidoreductase
MAWQHGWAKWVSRKDFLEGGQWQADPTGLFGRELSFYLLTAAELVCAAAVALGLFTRLAAIPPAFAMGVAFFVAHEAQLGGANSGEMGLLYMAMFTTLIFTGGGSLSLDGLIGRRGGRG